MAIVFEGKTYDQDWHEIDAMGRRLTGQKDWAANADYASKTGTQNPYTNQAGSSPHDASGLIPGNEPGSTLPKGPAAGGWLDTARIAAYQRSLQQQTQRPSVPPPATTGGSGGAAPDARRSSTAPPATNPAVYTDREQARQGLTNVYRQYLGREPGEGDIDKWLSGAYGYGSGLQDYDKFVAAIMGSPEARAYRPPSNTNTGDPGYQSIEWWQQQGVPAIDIVDPTTGQLRPGWARTAKGYERTGGTGTGTGTGTTTTGPRTTTPTDVQPWFMNLVKNLAPSPQSLKSLEPILNQFGIKLGPLNARGFNDAIVLPDGSVWDVIIGATADGGQGWWFSRVDHSGGGGTGGGTPPGGGVGGGTLPPSQYDDPHTRLLEQLMLSRIGQLQQPVYDPARQGLMSAYEQRARELGQGLEPAYQALLARLEERFKDLQGPGFTGAENEVLRTQALDPIESDRSAARQRVLERLSARGITPESGIAQQALLEVDNAFDGMRAATQTTLAATDLQRREDRNQRADAIRGTLYDIPQARAREQLDVFGAMELLEQAMRGEDQSRSREAIGYGGALADLGPQRLQLAMAAAGMGGNPQGIFNSLMQMAQLNQNQSLLNQRNSGQLWSGLGSIAYMLMNAGR